MKHRALLAYLLALCWAAGCGSGSSPTPTPTPTTPPTATPNITGQWMFMENGNFLFVNLVQNGETLTASAAADTGPATCTPTAPNAVEAVPGQPLGGCSSIVPCNETVSGSITNAGGINTLTLTGCPGTGNTVTFTSTIDATGRLATGGTEIHGFWSSSIAGNYQGTVTVPKLAGNIIESIGLCL